MPVKAYFGYFGAKTEVGDAIEAVCEVSIVLSACLGTVCLGEKNGRQKLLGAVLITLGVIAIGLSR